MKYGACDIKVPNKSVLAIIWNEVMNPFYIFQIFAIGFWYYDEYYDFSNALVFITVISILYATVDTKLSHNRIVRLGAYTTEVELLKKADGTKEKVNSGILVPGDVIVVPSDKVLPCDLILLSGKAIMAEAILTGESVPVLKTGIPYQTKESYSEANAAKHTLFSGTTVIQTK